MKIWLIIYIAGFFATLWFALKVFEDERGKVNTGELMFSLLVSLFSWTGYLALMVGYNIKKNNHS